MSSPILGGRYRILKHLGGGGFGQTFLAQDLHLPGKPTCVVKRLQPRTTDGVSLDSARRLFQLEAEALAALGNHDQIPRLLAHFEENAQFYLVQELIEGRLMTEEIRPGQPVPESQVVEIVKDILTTLSFVHEHQVIHRDIKPSNLIRRDRDRKIVLIDFGSVKQISNQSLDATGQVSITVAIGSLGYMPNEQLAGHPCLSSDIYAVGILAVQALTGMDPKRIPKNPRTSELLWRDLVSISPGLADVLDKMVKYDFRQRYPSAAEALKALNRAVKAPISLIIPQPASLTLSSEALDAHIAWLERADELFEQNRFEDAARCYEKVVQVQPGALTAYFKLGLALENLGQHSSAVEAYRRITEQQPEDYLAWLKLGKALEQLQHYPEALAAYEEVLELQPHNYWVWADRGQLLEALHRPEEALAAYDRAIQLKPDFQLALNHRQRLLVSLKRIDELYTLQHFEAAIAACDQVLKENPQDASAWMMRGMALENQQRFAEAAIAYNTVISLQADDHIAWFRLGNMLESLGHLKRAAKAYRNVTRLQPHNHWAWYQLGRVYEAMGDRTKAVATYQQVLTLQPTFQPAIEAHQRLQDPVQQV